MKTDLVELQEKRRNDRLVDRNSLSLVLLLTAPSGIMAASLSLWPDAFWTAESLLAAVGIVGSVTAILLAVFIIARYRARPATVHFGAGLMALGIINGFQALSSPGSPASVWLHAAAGTFGGLLFILYVLKVTARPRLRSPLFLSGIAGAAFVLGVLITALSDVLPAVAQQGTPTAVGWAINAVPAGLFFLAGFGLFRKYWKTGAHEHLLLAAILIFLFQAAEVFALVRLWNVTWWVWQGLRLAAYLAALGYILRELIRLSDSLATEVLEHTKTEAALQRSEDSWRSTFDSMEDAVLVIDRDYAIERINQRGLSLLGKSESKIVGRKCFRIIYGEPKPCDSCPHQRALESREVASVERHDQLPERHLRIRSTPIVAEDGEVTRCVYSMRDITEQVNTEARLKRLQHELSLTSRLASIGKVAASITHEINNPLTGVIAFAQMLMQMDIPENMREAVEVIHDGANRVVGIVDKLLTFARRDRPDKEYTDINAIITNTLAMRSYEMRINDIAVTAQLAPDLPKTMANVGQLQQVFLNIIINAEQAMTRAHGPGELSVTSERVGSGIRVSIADNGPGIAEDVLGKLFDPFFTTKDEDGGTGLGLSISQGIIKEHGGRIYARSVLGQGATFVVDLPIVAATRPPSSEGPVETNPGEVTAARVMVVDDEPHIRRALDRLLTEQGHKVDTVSSAQAALNKLNRARYDLVLLDLRMPGMSGIQFYDRMKEVDPSLQQKVVCVTGDVVSPTNRDFLRETGIPCVAKPFGVDDLMRQVNQVLEGAANAQITYPHSR